MGMYINGLCQNLPEWIFGLSIVGGIVVYLIVGFLVACLVKLLKDEINMDLLILALIFWPIVIVVGIAVAVVSAVSAIFYYVAVYLVKFFALPVTAVDKHDLRVAEDRILDKIDTKITREDNKIMKYLEYDYVPPKKVRKAKKPAKDKASKKKKAKK